MLVESCVHGLYLSDCVIDVCECFLEPEISHSEWANVVKNTNDDIIRDVVDCSLCRKDSLINDTCNEP